MEVYRLSHPKLEMIIKKMEKGKDFDLTRSEYIILTGCDIPQEKNYTEKRSAVAQRAREHGYDVIVIPERLVFKKHSK